MEKMKMVVPTLFGLEGIVARELRFLDCEEVQAENGRVLFSGSWEDVARANLNLRSGERVQILLARFFARTFDELFEGVKKIPLEEYIGKHEAFPVKGWSLNSQLHSVPDCQKIIKKAAVERLKSRYHVSWFEETGATVQLQFSILKDEVMILLDTSGAGLHKRGYRKNSNEAPIKETLAAGILSLARVRSDTVFCDPMCGSGTFLIEAAMDAMHIAPGINRKFACEKWGAFPAQAMRHAREAALDRIRRDAEFRAYGYDISEEAVALTQENAKKAGVSSRIRVKRQDIRKFSLDDLHSERSTIVCNPPYGERLLEVKAAQELCAEMGKVFPKRDGVHYFVITPDEQFEQVFGRKADKRRKLYNGMIKCQLYQYFK